MHNEASIILENISKKYKLYNSVQDRLKEIFSIKKKYHEDFWALKDINLTIPKGHTIGIVGRNGSGKSTLLQLITSIIHPTTGSLTVHGKIAALLELGTGFNPEFTGMQNIELNCTLMGLTKEQINDRIDAITSFADIGEFIHRPLRTYSSGMRARLGFATAINVDPDILIVDEALSVGDARFQQKCYQKFLRFQEAGKTILLVTHDIHAIPRYCDLAILLEAGQIIEVGEPKKIVSMYSELLLCGSISKSDKNEQKNKTTAPKTNTVQSFNFSAVTEKQTTTIQAVKNFIQSSSAIESIQQNPLYNKNEYRFGDGKAKILDFLVASGSSINPITVESGTQLDFYFKVCFYQDILFPLLGLSIKTRDGVLVYAINTRFLKLDLPSATEGEIRIYKFSLKLDLSPGDWFFDLGVAEKLPTEDPPCDIRNNALHLQVLRSNFYDGLVELETSFEEVTSLSATEKETLEIS